MEIWLRENKDAYPIKESLDDRRDEFFSEMHGETGFGGYDYFRFEVTAQDTIVPISSASRRRNTFL